MTPVETRSTAGEKETKVAIEDVLMAAWRLKVSTDVLAAIGARLGAAPDTIPAEVAAAIDDVLGAAGIPPLDGLTPQQRAMGAGVVRTMFGQAADLLAAPERPPGWSYTDVAVLDGQGRGSMVVPGLLAQTGEFGEVTSFLDVGTGVGWLAVAAAQVWPSAAIVGIDTYDLVLERARENIAGAGIASRVELRRQSVTELDDTDRFDLTWFPSFFIARELLAAAFARVFTATRPGGHIAVGRYEAPPDPIAQATQRLWTLRDGGSWLDDAEAVELLTAVGWRDVHPLPRTARVPLGFIAGRRPEK
jgi:SAM-dependent methyltransferase